MRTRSSRSILSNLRFPSGFRIGIRGYATTTTTTTTHPVTGPKNNHHSTAATAAAAAPPPPRPFKPLPAHERIARYPDHALEDSATSTEKNGKEGGRAKEILSRLWRYASSSTSTTASTSSTTKSKSAAQPEPIYPSSPDPQRGIEAARRVVREGVLDARYSRAAKNFTLVMCALPIAIYTSYELFQRRFRGKLQKGRVVEREGDGDGDVGESEVK